MNHQSVAQLQKPMKTMPPATSSVLRRKCACGQHTVAGGECAECRKKRLGLQRQAINQAGPTTAPPIVNEVLRSPGQPLDAKTRAFMEPRFGHDFSGVRVHTGAPKQIQTKLTVNQPGDKYEREADRLAEQVMRMPGSDHLQRKCACGGTPGPTGECAECRKKRLGLQRQAISQAGPTTAPPIVNEVLRSPGQPLDPATRTFMEPRFRHDFSQVRVHTDTKATESVRAVNALAYTVGRDIVFGTGQYSPATSKGRQMLAHELVHVVQQSGGAFQGKVEVGQPGNVYEQEAERISERVDMNNRVHRAMKLGLQNPSASASISTMSVAKLQRWLYGSGTPPHADFVEVPNVERPRVEAALRIVERIVTNPRNYPRCHRRFQSLCPTASATELADRYNNATVWKTTDPSEYGSSVSPDHVAYEDETWRWRRWLLASTFVHEFMHNCGFHDEARILAVERVCGLPGEPP